MSLTSNQSSWIAAVTTASADFVAAVTAAFEADNDPTTQLSDVRTRRSALAATGLTLAALLGTTVSDSFGAAPFSGKPQRATNAAPTGLKIEHQFPNGV